MILDSSAIVAIMRIEPEALAFAEMIARVTVVSLSAATFLESALVLGPHNDGRLDRFVESARAHIEAVTASQARLARLAYRRFGRGTGHPARLNFGDCFSYALAMERGEPLLFKGNDFSQTDVLVAR